MEYGRNFYLIKINSEQWNCVIGYLCLLGYLELWMTSYRVILYVTSLDEVYSWFGETYMTRPLDPPVSKNRMTPDWQPPKIEAVRFSTTKKNEYF